MTSINGSHLMKSSFLVLHQNDPLKQSIMACPRGKIAPHPAPHIQENGRRPRGIPRTSPRIRGQQSPVQESRVATHLVNGTESGGETRLVKTNHEKNSLYSQHASPVPSAAAKCIKKDDGTAVESDSSTSTSLEPSLPQHKIDDSLPDELKYQAIFQRNKDILLRGLSLTSAGGGLTLINLSRRNLTSNEAKLIRQAMHENPHLAVMKLAYNDLGDEGAVIIASGFVVGGEHHKNLSVLDLGFNGIGDEGCAALALQAVAGNQTLGKLYLSGNNIREKGALSLAGAMLHGCSLTSLHITANHVGAIGIQALARAVAENEAYRNAQMSRENGNQSPNHCELKTMEELYLGDTSMTANGFIPVPSMLMTNLSLRILCLSNNGLDDQSMSLLSQAIYRNKNVPLESVQLSFNEITCVGLECFMNAIWGSQTLRELKIDNNRIQDRGAQLAAVVLTSIDLEVLDIGFNRITHVGIKALMKSLSETSSLQILSISGIPLDATACKAVSYGLAYSSSLRAFHVDSCQAGYSGQRHIVAGIVSNRRASLRVLTGFELGAIAVTLQLPKVIEKWSNEKLLRFVCFMWTEWNKLQAVTRRVSVRKAQVERSDNSRAGEEKKGEEGEIEPADPRTVNAAAQRALALIGNNLDSSLNTEPYERNISETSPFVPANATMLERTLSGTIRVPPLVESHRGLIVDVSLDVDSSAPGRDGARSPFTGTLLDPLRTNRNLEWLRGHFRSLDEVSRLPFDSADLWHLHQYFFSPPLPQVDTDSTSTYTQTTDTYTSDECAEEKFITSKKLNGKTIRHSHMSQCSPLPTDASQRANLGRTISFQMLGEAALSAHSSTNFDSLYKRRPAQSEDEEETEDESMHKNKRARNFKPRIAYYPRIRKKLETLDTKPSQEETLSLLRLLKFVESLLFQDRDPFAIDAPMRDLELPSRADVEMIILDLR